MRQGRKEQRERDWLDRILDELQARKEQGESPSLVYLLEALLNELMKRERKRFLEQHPQEKANGFYRRSLKLTMGELKLSVPRVRYGHTLRPSILPPPWALRFLAFRRGTCSPSRFQIRCTLFTFTFEPSRRSKTVILR